MSCLTTTASQEAGPGSERVVQSMKADSSKLHAKLDIMVLLWLDQSDQTFGLVIWTATVYLLNENPQC